MNGIFKYILVFLLSTAAVSASAQKVYTVDQVPDVHRYDGTRYVSDPDNILSAGSVTELNRIAADIEKLTGAETAVVVLPSIGYDTPEGFAEQLFARWGIGKKGNDNGLLILLVTEDRFIRFEVGYGLEGVLTDAISKRIQSQRMNTYLGRGDWDQGLVSGLSAVRELLTDPNHELRSEDPLEQGGEWVGFIFILLFMGMIWLLVYLANRRARKCPRCGHQMKVVNRTERKISPGVREITTYLRCPNCGYTTHRSQRQNIGDAVAGGAIGGALGSLGRGGASGGFGGGWGGGRSGGGGATSRF